MVDVDVKNRRVERMESLVEGLEELDGVDRVVLDDYVPGSASSGQIAVFVESDGGVNLYGDTGVVYDLKPNLRSLAQRMRSVLRSADVLNTTVYERPSKEYGVNGPLGHDSEMYMIEVIP